LLAQELKTVDTSAPHEHLPHAYAPRWPSALVKEHSRIESGVDREQGVDMSRYEAIEVPEEDSGDSAEYRDALKKAYAQSSYLSWREMNLGMLEKYGKNSWLISNSQLEHILKQLEIELAESKRALAEEESLRKTQQEAVAGEMLGLDEGWKKGIGKIIETELAVEDLRQQILERRRATAS
jgi:pre-mRNA-splicing factor SPF27